jgi:hypothetical protein
MKKGIGVADGLRLHLGFESARKTAHVELSGKGRPSVDVFLPHSVSACTELLLMIQRWIAHAERPPEPVIGRGLSGLKFHDAGEMPNAKAEVTQIRFGSPFELQILLAGLSPPGLGLLLYAAKRFYGYDLELKTHRETKRIEYLKAIQSREALERQKKTAREKVDDLIDQPRARREWRMTMGEIEDDED